MEYNVNSHIEFGLIISNSLPTEKERDYFVRAFVAYKTILSQYLQYEIK